MTHVRWLVQSAADVPATDNWLAPSERRRCDGLPIAKRRTDWLLGRWTAKLAIASVLNVDVCPESLAGICLVPGPDGAPVARLGDRDAPISTSISHRAGTALCVVAQSGNVVGCDLEVVEPRSDPFLSDYFTRDEQSQMDKCSGWDRSRCAALLWSAKESVLKLLHAGLRLDTRSVSVRLMDELVADNWRPFRATFVNEATFRGWWRETGGLVSTLVAFPPPAPPAPLNLTVDTGYEYNLPSGKIRMSAECRSST